MEAAIVLPFVLVLGLGTIEFGWLMSQIEDVQLSLRDAVRYASRSQLVTVSGVDDLPAATKTAARDMIGRAYLRNGITSTPPLPVLSSIPNTSGLNPGRSTVHLVTATARFDPASAGLLSLINLTLPPITLHYEARHVGG
jgi:Flp pilus assembly protein TadG